MSILFWLILALAGAPLFVVIVGSALLGFWQTDLDLMVVGIELGRLIEIPVLVAIPLFTLAGYILGESKAPQRLVRLTQALTGWMPGGLAIMALIASAFFTAFTGASGITIVALGAILLPALQTAGYSQRFNLGLVTTSGSLGLLFAPSLPLILYAVVAQQLSLSEGVSVDNLFRAGLTPGILMLVLLGIYAAIKAPRRTQKDREFSGREIWQSCKDAIWELPLPIVVLGGIYGGFFAVSDAAVITVTYVLIVEVLIHREISFAHLMRIVHESMTLVGAILVILGASLASTNYMIEAEIPAQVFSFVQEQVQTQTGFLLWTIVFLLILGMILDIFSALVIVTPMLLPLALQYGVDPVHMGILFLAVMQLGYMTPPVGMNLFISSFRFNEPVLKLYRATLPFFFILLLAVLLIAFWPALSLWLVPE